MLRGELLDRLEFALCLLESVLYCPLDVLICPDWYPEQINSSRSLRVIALQADPLNLQVKPQGPAAQHVVLQGLEPCRLDQCRVMRSFGPTNLPLMSSLSRFGNRTSLRCHSVCSAVVLSERSSMHRIKRPINSYRSGSCPIAYMWSDTLAMAVRTPLLPTPVNTSAERTFRGAEVLSCHNNHGHHHSHS